MRMRDGRTCVTVAEATQGRASTRAATRELDTALRRTPGDSAAAPTTCEAWTWWLPTTWTTPSLSQDEFHTAMPPAATAIAAAAAARTARSFTGGLTGAFTAGSRPAPTPRGPAPPTCPPAAAPARRGTRRTSRPPALPPPGDRDT